MDYFADKAQSLTSSVLTRINARINASAASTGASSSVAANGSSDSQQQQPTLQQQPVTQQPQLPQSLRVFEPASSTQWQQTVVPVGPNCRRRNFAMSAPFGGESSTLTAPPIGFNLGAIQLEQPAAATTTNRVDDEDADAAGIRPPAPSLLALPVDKSRLEAVSRESLYDASVWELTWFFRCFVLAILRLLLFIRKLYEDYSSARAFTLIGNLGYTLTSFAVLLLPTTVFTVYRVSRYLQVVLPTLRNTSQSQPPQSQQPNTQQKSKDSGNKSVATDMAADTVRQAAIGFVNAQPPPRESDALMGSNNDHEDDDDVTAKRIDKQHARHASLPNKLQNEIEQQQRTASPTQIIPSIVSIVQDDFRPVDVSKLGKLATKNSKSTGMALGAFEQFIHGVMYVFWQLKRQVDLVSYLVERICAWRKPLEEETDEINVLGRHSDGLEFFQDFYSAFLAILIQLCRQFNQIALIGQTAKTPHLTNTTVAAAITETSTSAPTSKFINLAGFVHSTRTGSSSNDPSTSQNNSALFVVAGASSEVIVSTLVIWSLLVAVRRRDDGVLSLFLSTIGWGSIFFSRLFILALAYSEFGPIITLSLVLAHVLGITAWIYRIAIDSHNSKETETHERLRDIELDANSQTEDNNEERVLRIKAAANPTPRATDEWTDAEHASLISQIFFLFAIPSLFYWPFMFNLKLNYRPYKYMALILTQNFALIMSLLVLTPIDRTSTFRNNAIVETTSFNILTVLLPVAVASIVGFLFLCLYLLCKPSLTEYFAHADTIYNESKQSGIYYEFCSRVFKMPDLSSFKFRQFMNEVQIVEVTSN